VRERPDVDVTALKFLPLTPARWDDFEDLFGANGATGGCWCMYWKVRRSRWDATKGAGNRRAMKAIVETGPPPGLLAYHDRHAVGWCAVAPRETYPGLARSRILKPVDDRPVWSVSCVFVRRGYRKAGISRGLLRAAADYVRRNGGRIVEGYPTEPRLSPQADAFVFTGIASAFRAAGFREVARRSPTRPIMRLEVGGPVAARRADGGGPTRRRRRSARRRRG
jgi:GNAT superfamily N-acetyltransferase